MRFFHYSQKKDRYTMPRSSVVFSISVIIIASVLNGCLGPKFIQPARQSFAFDYTPSAQALAKTEGELSFALLDFQVEVEQDPRPQSIFTSNTSSGRTILIDRLARGLERDFSEIITAQGYGIRGPFESHSEMTYPDKEDTDLILFTRIVIQADHTNLYWERYENKDTYTLAIRASPPSRATLDVSFEFHIYESLSKEMLWAKSITLEPLNIDLLYRNSGGILYAGIPSFEVMLERDNSYHAAVGSLFKREYSNIIDRMIAYLHPKEMAQVNEAAKRVRAKKVY